MISSLHFGVLSLWKFVYYSGKKGKGAGKIKQYESLHDRRCYHH
jgi:hypothetical protein